MGAAASVRPATDHRWTKLRNFMIIKAFNLRASGETLEEQLLTLAASPNQEEARERQVVISATALCQYLQIPFPRRQILFEHLPRDEIPFSTLLRFLQGEEPLQVEILLPHREEQEQQQIMPFRTTPTTPTPTTITKQVGNWRKREITIQERIVEYTRIDEQGVPQSLVEREKQQQEVTHMESNEGEEFAHREVTTFEQFESVNDQVIVNESGKDEFVHLKSKHDEFSHFESSSNPSSNNNHCSEEDGDDGLRTGPPSPIKQF